MNTNPRSDPGFTRNATVHLPEATLFALNLTTWCWTPGVLAEFPGLGPSEGAAIADKRSSLPDWGMGLLVASAPFLMSVVAT